LRHRREDPEVRLPAGVRTLATVRTVISQDRVGRPPNYFDLKK
jgi:hypothetical protein